MVQIVLTERLATSPCLKGRLPEADGLTLGDALAFGTQRHGDAICNLAWGSSLVNVIDGFNKAALEAAEPPK